ncbi:MAG: TetR/AcrR family transcriptional regulator [Chloroflexia bacterium]|nr:TetR/AcrR family transcriptional regulator [Chloroflexia bacterium]
MSPRTEQQQQSAREESRQRILASALALFSRLGYERTSVRMIAGEAGISQGLLYNYFAGKDDVLKALFERSMHDVLRSFEALHGSDPPAERLRRYIRACFAIVEENLEFWRLAYGVRAQPAVLAGLGADLPAWERTILDTLEEPFRTLGLPHPQTEARILFALIDGLSQQYARDPEHFPLREVADAVVARYRETPPP